MVDRRLKLEPGLSQASIPAFLLKLRGLLDDPSTNELIRWDDTGSSFHLYNQTKFAERVLPQYFKHNNLASFVRQLNMYGFKKLTSVDQGALHSKDDMEFQNANFIRDEPGLMVNIKRKNAKSDRNPDVHGSTTVRDKLLEYDGQLQPSAIQDVLVDVKDLKTTQEGINCQLDVIKRENSVLWREIASLRQKHVQQQQIINKLIQFLMTMAGSRTTRNLKRSLPLMIQGAQKKRSRNISEQTAADLFRQQNDEHAQSTSTSVGSSPNGMIIQDVTDMQYPLDSSNASSIPLTDIFGNESDSLNASNGSTNSQALSTSQAVVPIGASPDLFKSQLSENIDELQSDIDILKDLFSGDSIGLPTESVSTLFDGCSDRIPTCLPTFQTQSELIDLDELINNTDTSTNENFLKSVSAELPDDIISGMIMPNSDTVTTETLENLIHPIEDNAEKDSNRPVISSSELD